MSGSDDSQDTRTGAASHGASPLSATAMLPTLSLTKASPLGDEPHTGMLGSVVVPTHMGSGMEPQPPETPNMSSEAGNGAAMRIAGSPGKPLIPTLNLSKLQSTGDVQQVGTGLALARQESLGLGTAVQLDESMTYRPSLQPSKPYAQGGLTHRKPALSSSGANASPSLHYKPSPPPTAPIRSLRQSQAEADGGGPMTPAKVLREQAHRLTAYEQSEVLEYPQVYFTGGGAEKVKASPVAGENNHGFDDERGDYLAAMHDHIAYRYEVLSVLGKGSFGQVMKGYDYKSNTMKAIKIIRNKKRFHQQALIEVKILEHLRHKDASDSCNVVHMAEYFYFRHHLCITFELLSINLYEFVKNNNFQGLSLGLIRRFAAQMLVSLDFLRKQNVIHCDLKPENILLRQPQKSAIKIIDFGSSCFVDERMYTYVQSRFYRSPEVLLGLPYDMSIDMWSFACILAELYMGYPLFPGEHEVEQLACIMEVLGVPPRSMLDASTRRKLFFDSNWMPRVIANSRGKKRRPSSKDLISVMRCNDPLFISFLTACLQWDPLRRPSPEEALQHEWIQEGAVPPPPPREQAALPRGGELYKAAPGGRLRTQDSFSSPRSRNSKSASRRAANAALANAGAAVSGGPLTSRHHFEVVPAEGYGNEAPGYMTARGSAANAGKAMRHSNVHHAGGYVEGQVLHALPKAYTQLNQPTISGGVTPRQPHASGPSAQYPRRVGGSRNNNQRVLQGHTHQRGLYNLRPASSGQGGSGHGLGLASAAGVAAKELPPLKEGVKPPQRYRAAYG